MDVDKDFQGDDEDSAMSVAFEAGEPQDEPSSSITSVEVDESDEFEDSETDLYLLNLSVTIAEIEGEEKSKRNSMMLWLKSKASNPFRARNAIKFANQKAALPDMSTLNMAKFQPNSHCS